MAVVDPNPGKFTRDWQNQVYMFGVSDTNDNGERFPEMMYTVARDQALAYLDTEIGISCPKTTFIEKHDLRSTEWTRWMYLKLTHRPVREIKSVSFHYGSVKIFECPLAWVNLHSPLSGQMTLMPIAGELTNVPLVGFKWLGMFGISTQSEYMPDFIHVEYTAGYDVPELPGDMTHVAGMIQSMMMLNIAGDLISGAGIASKSIGVDGLSQMINTTSSPTCAGYGARVIQYWKDLDRILPPLQRKYRGGVGLEVG